MYEHNENQMILSDDFFLPFGGRLNPDNRWVRMASLIPWPQIEEAYLQSLGDTNQGKRAFPARLALGSLIIKEKLGLSDEETVIAITENPYLQFFIGLSAFQEEAPFHPSSLTHFRKRFSMDFINELNESIVRAQQQSTDACRHEKDGSDDDPPTGGTPSPSNREPSPDGQTDGERPNRGELLIDATCAPSDITYPTDLGLLNSAREKLEGIIDALHESRTEKGEKPRTYRRRARREYLSVAKQRKPGREKIRRAVGQQLGYVERNLRHIETLVGETGLGILSRLQYRDLLVIQELCRQQRVMYDEKSHSVDDRIVSIRQPHVRPIVRGKAKAAVEFGAKLSVSLVDGYSFLDVLSWDAYHEGKLLKASIEAYRKRFGHYPEAVLADGIYRTRENRAYCKEREIRLSGPPLGRPSKNPDITREQKKLEQQDSARRNPIEGKFGEGKRTYGLGLIQARLQETGETVIALQFLVMNIQKILRDSFLPFFKGDLLWKLFASWRRLLTNGYKKRVIQ